MRFFADLKNIGQCRSGNIAIIAALAAPLLIGSLAISIDYGALSLQRRTAQSVADLAAITAASAPDSAVEMLLHYLKDNRLNYALEQDGHYLFPDGKELPKSDASAVAECLISFKTGKYSPDVAVPAQDRFSETTVETDAVQVTQTCRGKLYFASMLGEPPQLEVMATAAVQKAASFWIGSRLASLNGGVLNAVLGATLGSDVSLSVADYRALLGVDIELFSFMRDLKTEARIAGLTYNDILDAEVGMGHILGALRKSAQVSASTAAVLRSLQAIVSRKSETLRISTVINLEDIRHLPVETPQSGTAYAGLFDIVSVAALISGGDSQVLSGLELAVPGIAKLAIDVAIGERPVGSQSIAIGHPGSRVRTAQIRIRLDARIGGQRSLLGTSIHLPVYVEVANAEARIAAINCRRATSQASVDIEAVPGIAEIAIGVIKSDAFINFTDAPRLAKADLITAPGLKISGSAQVDINNVKSKKLTFSAQEIRQLRVKSVSTGTLLESAVKSLANNLRLDINILGINKIINPFVFEDSLRLTLHSASSALDSVLYNTLLAMGVRIGEVDVSVTGVRCASPVLVL